MAQIHDYAAAVGHILIADDDHDFRKLLVRRAKRMGLTVEEASDGEEAIEAVNRKKFDALVVDLYMPGATGLEVFEIASRADSEIQAILLTGNATLETAIEALRAGAYDYLTKPLESLTIFELALTRALERRYLMRENQRLFAEVERLALTDPLTGLYNRHKLNDTLDAEVERAKRYGRPLALIMLDMDDLKRINDSYGHAAGDRVLQEVASAIKDEIRMVDIATRFGGDEFLILLPEADLEEATSLALRIHARGSRIALDEDPVSFSIGVAELSTDAETKDMVIDLVDRSLYEAKRQGRGRVSAGGKIINTSKKGKGRVSLSGSSSVGSAKSS